MIAICFICKVEFNRRWTKRGWDTKKTCSEFCRKKLINASNAKYRNENRARCRQAVRAWTDDNRSYARLIQRRYYIKHREKRLLYKKNRRKETCHTKEFKDYKAKHGRIYWNKARTELRDVYLKKLLTQGTRLAHQDIPEALVKAYKALVLVKRSIKTKVKLK